MNRSTIVKIYSNVVMIFLKRVYSYRKTVSAITYIYTAFKKFQQYPTPSDFETLMKMV